MPYHVRAFCTSDAVPTIRATIDGLRAEGVEARADVDDPAELDSPDWTGFELTYKPGKRPIPVDCDRNTGDDSLAAQEVLEFLAELEDFEDSPARRKVSEHLKSTRFIVCCQLLSDIDDDGYDANVLFLRYFVAHCGGLIYADLEGFYEGDDLLLPMR